LEKRKDSGICLLFNGLWNRMSKQPPDDSYSKDEVQRRFLGALKAGLSTPPKPLKDKPRVRKRTAKKQGRPSKSGA
jgi:hypothetical protein